MKMVNNVNIAGLEEFNMYKTEIDKIRLSLASKTQFWSLKQVTWYYYFVFLINLYWSIAALLLERK